MAFDLKQLQAGGEIKPPRILIYGVQGIGKTDFAASFPAPIVVQTEDGLAGFPNVVATPVCKTYEDVMGWLTTLATTPHEFKTLVIDSMDWFEPLIYRAVCRKANVSSLEELKYGKGYVMAMDFWRDFIDAINYLRNECDMAIVEVSHSSVKRYNSPENDPYDRYQVKLYDKAAELLQEHSDLVIFCNYRVIVQQKDAGGFNNKVNKAVGGQQRFMYTQERPAFHAKARYDMPAEILMEKGKAFAALAPYIPYYNQKATAAPAGAVNQPPQQ